MDPEDLPNEAPRQGPRGLWERSVSLIEEILDAEEPDGTPGRVPISGLVFVGQ